MSKRMLIDDTHKEETRVVIINGNKLEDVEFETSSRRQIKGNIYLAKVMRVEPSLQAAFVDYGGNKHGFLAFSEIHPDYYNLTEEELAEVDREVDEAIEAKKQLIKDKEAEREKLQKERAAKREAEALAKTEGKEAAAVDNETSEAPVETAAEDKAEKKNKKKETAEPKRTRRKPKTEKEPLKADDAVEADAAPVKGEKTEESSDKTEEEKSSEANGEEKKRVKKRLAKKYTKKKEELKVLAEAAGTESETISEEVSEIEEVEESRYLKENNEISTDVEKHSDNIVGEEVADDDDEEDDDFELQRRLMKVRKLFHKSNIKDVIKEGQILLIQVVKEERGNKGAALTTYLSLAGRYCVLMPNRIKSGGVSRKITNANDRKRLKDIIRDLPLTSDMSMIVRTAGEEKSQAEIIRDYNYLMRSWNQIRLEALKKKAPALVHEEGNLIKRALRDIYSKEITEIIVDGDRAYKEARDFIKILAPNNLNKIKSTRKGDIPLFQRFQIESQLDKLHDTTVQLESGGYLVINPTEALVAIDVNSGRATKEKDLEETALKTNLEAADEIARQLRMRNLAGLVVIDFIDMEENKNNLAVEKRMKEALKTDRSRIQIGKMSCFGLLEISRQRLHSSFLESSYQVCPHCQGKGFIRTIESSAVLVLRDIEEECIKNRSSKLNIAIPTEVAIYVLNNKRQAISELEQRYGISVVISADDSIKNISDYKIERTKLTKNAAAAKEEKVETPVEDTNEEVVEEATESHNNNYERNNNRRSRRRNGKYDRNRRGRNDKEEKDNRGNETVMLYNSHADNSGDNESNDDNGKKKGTWWKRLIKS